MIQTIFIKILNNTIQIKNAKAINQTLQNVFYPLDQLGNVKLELLSDIDMLLMVEKKNAGLKHFNDCKAFNENSNDMDDIYENFEKCNPN